MVNWFQSPSARRSGVGGAAIVAATLLTVSLTLSQTRTSATAVVAKKDLSAPSPHSSTSQTPSSVSSTSATAGTTPTSPTQKTSPSTGSSSSGSTSGGKHAVTSTGATPSTVGSAQSYTPPSNVAPTHVQAQWSLGGPSAEWNGYPIAVGMGDPVNARVASPVTLELQVDQAAAYSSRVTLTQPMTFQVSICMGVPVHQANGTTGYTYGGRVVWRGILPPLHTVQGGAHLQFQWSGQDASGKQVPAGTYFAELRSPLPAVQYAITGGKSGTETLAYTPRTMTGQHYDEGITLTS